MSLHESLRALEKKWREMAANEYRAAANAKEKGAEIAEVANESSAYAMRKCADDLRALLTTRQEVAPVADAVEVLRQKLANDEDGWRALCVVMAALPTGQTSDAMDGEIARLRRCLGFFASAIKSGESWSATCQSEYDAAMLVRDVCEMAPADPDAPDTVCIRVSDLTRIAEQYTHLQDASGDAEDAARWRYVRKDGLIWRVNMLALAKDDIDILFGAKADAAIDAAMQAKEAK